MEVKRMLKGWQMGLLVGLLVFMLSTMFMPAFHLNGKVVRKMFSYFISSTAVKDDMEEDEYEELEDYIKDKLEDAVDDELKEFEKEKENDITSFSPLRIMMNDYGSLIYGKDAKKKDLKNLKNSKYYKKISKGVRSLRIVLVIEYSLAVIVMILVIVAFAAEWSKTIPIVISTIYGGLSAILFGYCRFGMLRVVGKKYVDLIEDEINDYRWDVWDKVTIDISGGKLLSYLYSGAFLIAFIIAILILVVSIVSLVTGNNEQILDYDGDYGYGGDGYGGDSYGEIGGYDSGVDATQGLGLFVDGFDQGGNRVGFEVNGKDAIALNGMNNMDVFSEDQIAVTMAASQVTEAANLDSVIPAQTMGKVRCTKGVAVGQGFQLPKDRKVIVGKSPSKSNLTINHPNVSNIHCSIRYNPTSNTYIVKDHSLNGTFVNGNRLPKDVAIEYPAGTVLVLADGTNEITLG